MAMTQAREVYATIVAQDTGTDWIDCGGQIGFDISIDMGAASTITLQKRTISGGDLNGDIMDVEAYTTDTEKAGENGAGCQMRLWCKTGDYGASTPVRLAVGGRG
jgi:hypothetical protein